MPAVTTLATVAFVGGTGKLGRGLALRLAAAGHPVLIGSRSEDRAEETAAKLRERLAGTGRELARLDGTGNLAALSEAEIVFLTLPFETLDPFLVESGALLRHKIVVDVVNPLQQIDGRFALLPIPGGSAGARAQHLVPEARVVSAFKNAAAGHLLQLEHPVAGDILLASDDAAAKSSVSDLVHAIPALRPVDAGPLANGSFLEAMTALQLNLNQLHKSLTTIKILGLD